MLQVNPFWQQKPKNSFRTAMQTKAFVFLGLLSPTIPTAPAMAGPAANAAGLVPKTGADNPRALLDPRLAGAKGQVDIVIQLADPSLAAIHAKNAKKTGNWLSKAQQRSHLDMLNSKQDALTARVHSLGGAELARVAKALTAVVIRIDASQLLALAAHPNIISIRPVMNYQLDLSETVPYVGAAAVQAAGFDGKGVRAAVLDSGVDYTHRNLGGPGTLAAYTAAYGTDTTDPRNTTLDGLFPTAKVIGGYDFVGEGWPNTDLAPDPDPIDFDGHGTHVTDIIAGH